MMRIALFSGNYNYLREGANRALNRLVDYAERAADCTVRAYSPVTDTPAFEPAGTLVPVSSIALPVRDEFRLALGLSRGARVDLGRFAPQIVHVSTPDILGTRAQSWARSRGIPLVASMHTMFESYLDYYGLASLRPLAEAHLRRFYRRADHVLAPTPALVEKMKEMRGDDNVSVWSRGIDRQQFSPACRDMPWRRAQGLADDDIAVLFFGRLVLEKGIDIYTAAMADLAKRRLPNGGRIRPLVVGAGPAIESFIAIDGAVLTGHLDGSELARAVASADMMLTPSTTETFGQVVLESMASCLPIISADAPSARALIEDGLTGFFCDPRVVPDYVAAVDRLAENRELRLAMGEAGRKASAAYDWDAASASVTAIYERLLQR